MKCARMVLKFIQCKILRRGVFQHSRSFRQHWPSCMLSECPPPAVTSQTHKHRRALADISHTHNPQYHKPSIMSSTPRKQRKADDEENQATRSRTRNAARLGSALSLRSTVNSIAEDEIPIPVTEDASVVSAFDTISEAPSFPPPTTVSSKTSRSSTRTRSLSPKKRVATKRESPSLYLKSYIFYMVVVILN